MHSNGVYEEDLVLTILGKKQDYEYSRFIDDDALDKLKHWQREEQGFKFYKTNRWVKFRIKHVLPLDHNECQICKHVFKRYRKANTIHHVHHIDEYPELAFNVWDEEGFRNLISLCHACHELVHPEKQLKFKIAAEEKLKLKKESQLTDERWD